MSDFNPQIGDPCNWVIFSDVEPCTVIARTRTTVTVRCNATKLSKPPVMVPGGFAGVVTQPAEWCILPELQGGPMVFSLRRDGQWKLQGISTNTRGNVLRPGHRKVYDYGF